VDDQIAALADSAHDLAEQVGDLVLDALRTQTRGGDEAEGAKELERQLARARRSLVKASQILRELGGR
jgi:hypothetical protein